MKQLTNDKLLVRRGLLLILLTLVISVKVSLAAEEVPWKILSSAEQKVLQPYAETWQTMPADKQQISGGSAAGNSGGYTVQNTCPSGSAPDRRFPDMGAG